MSSNNFQMGHCEDCLMYKCEVASLKGRIEQLEKEKAKLYDRCLEFVAALPLSKSVSKKRRRLYMGASLGNGWTVDVIAHIFNCIESANEAKAIT